MCVLLLAKTCHCMWLENGPMEFLEFTVGHLVDLAAATPTHNAYTR